MTRYLEIKPGSLEEVVKTISDDYQDVFKKELEKTGKSLNQMTDSEKKAFFNKIDKMYNAKNEELSAAQKKLPPALQKAIKDKEEKNEAVDNPYAVGMAAAMKQTGDKPPLKKSTITKAHDIAKSIEKDDKKEENLQELSKAEKEKRLQRAKDMIKYYDAQKKAALKGPNKALAKKMLKNETELEEVTQKEVDKFHTSLDKLVHKSFGHSSDEKKKEMKKETHSFVTNKMNQKQKDAGGEKEIITKEAVDAEAISKQQEKIRNMSSKISSLDKEDPKNKNKASIMQSDLTTAKLKLRDMMQKKTNTMKTELKNLAMGYKKFKESLKTTKESESDKKKDKISTNTDDKTTTMTDKPVTQIDVDPSMFPKI